MHAAIAVPGSASTILTHVFGRGLADERYVVERFQAVADGDIRRVPGDAAPAKGRREAKRTIASLKAVREMRPAPTEIIVCTGLRIKGGVQNLGRHRYGAFLRPQAEALIGIPRERPAGHAPAGRPSSGFHFWQGGCHGVPRPRSPARQGPRTLPPAHRRTHRPAPLPQMRRAAARTGPRSVRAMLGEAKQGLPRQGLEAPGRRQAAERRARGLCPNCGKQPPAPDASLCEPRSGQRREAARARYAKGNAAGKPHGGRDPEQRRKMAREQSRRRLHERLGSGPVHPMRAPAPGRGRRDLRAVP